MLKRRGARTDPGGTPLLRRPNLLRLPLAVVRVKLILPTSSMIKRTMCLSSSNRSNSQLQAALIVVIDVITGFVWFIIDYEEEWWQHITLSKSNTHCEWLWFNSADTDTDVWAGKQVIFFLFVFLCVFFSKPSELRSMVAIEYFDVGWLVQFETLLLFL